MLKHKCIICRKELNHGIIINGRVICKSCEERLVKSEIGTDLYSYYRDCIRKSVAGSILKEEELVYQDYR